MRISVGRSTPALLLADQHRHYWINYWIILLDDQRHPQTNSPHSPLLNLDHPGAEPTVSHHQGSPRSRATGRLGLVLNSTVLSSRQGHSLDMVHPFFLLAFLALLGVIEAKCPYKNYTGCPPWVQERRREIEERNRKKFEEDERINKFHRTRGPIPSTSGPYEFTKPDIYIMLNKHNNYRSYMANGLLKGKQAKNMYKLVWDPLLQKSAQEWANKCTIEASNTPDVGENRYVLDDDSRLKLLLSMVAEMAVMEWTDEPDYSPLSEDNKYRAGIDSAISNYTQLVWGATTKFGCGGCVRYEESGNRSTYIICHYQVKGNIDGEYIYEVGGGCANDDDCTTYSGSKCEVSTKLCLPSDYVEEKFF